MDGRVRDELGRAIQREGVSLYENPQRVRAHLMDTCPHARTEIGLLVGAMEDEIPARLVRSSGTVFSDAEIARSISDLKQTRRLDDAAAAWVVRSWAAVLGLGDAPSDDVADAQGGTSPERPQFTGSSTPTSGPVSSAAGSQPWAAAGAGAESPVSTLSSDSHPRESAPGWPNSRSTEQYTAGWASVPPPPISAPPAPPTWNQPPAGMSPTGSWGGGQPPSNPPWGTPGANPPPPPRRGRGRLFGLLGALVAVAVLAVGVLVVIGPGPQRMLPPPGPVPTSSPTPPTTNSPGGVGFTVVDALNPDLEIADTVSLYSFGTEVGTMSVDAQSPTAQLDLVAEPPRTDYQLRITMILNDADRTQVTLNGNGTVPVYEGAEYSVQITKNDQGDFEATLRPEQGSSAGSTGGSST